jgi:Arm DNA-binding domain
MARPRSDGLPSLPPSKKLLTRQLIKNLTVVSGRTLVWDSKLGGLALACYPSGRKVYKVIYSFGRRTRWFTIGRADQIDLDDARKLAAPPTKTPRPNARQRDPRAPSKSCTPST